MPTPLDQAGRPLEIQTPLGEGVLGLRSMIVREQLGRLFSIEAEFSSTHPDVKFDEIVGHPVVVRLDLPGGGVRFWHAFVARFQYTGSTDRFSHYRALLMPWLWALTRSSDCRIFQQQAIPDIVQQVFRDRGSKDFQTNLSGSYPTLEYCVQYRETDFNFVSRLLEREGIAYYFKHTKEKGVLVLADEKASYEPAEGYAEVLYRPGGGDEAQQEAVKTWVIEHEVQPTQYALTDYNPLRPTESLLRTAQIERGHGINDRQMFDFPGAFELPAEAERISRMRLEELHVGSEVVRAAGTVMGLGAGHLFKLKDHPRAEQNAEHLVTSVTLQYDAGEFDTGDQTPPRYACEFTAIPSAQAFRPARTTPKPVVHGPQPAVVVGPSGEEIHTDEHGRVKVHFHWNRESKGDATASCWVRVAQGWAGKKWGSLFLPRIGHEVLVEFLEGDPDRPIITGSVYNGANKPPYDLPAEKTKSTLKSLSSKGGGGFNEFRFEDKKGSEEVHLHAEKDHTIKVKNNQITAIGNERHETVEKKVITHFKDEHHLKVTKDEFTLHEADTHAIIKGSRHEKVDGAENLTVGGDRMTNVKGAENLTVGGDRMTKVDGADNLKITKDFAVETGKKTSFKASDIFGKASGAIAFDGGDIHIKGGKTVIIEAGTQLSLKVGGSFIDIGPSGVAIVGPQAKINSGGSAGSGGGCTPVAPAAPASADEPDPKDPAAPPEGQAGEITNFSAAAAALKYAALTGLPFCEECPREQPPPPAPETPEAPGEAPATPAATAEIEINDTPETTDDIVRLKGGNPVVRHRVPCRIRLTSSSPADVPVVITNPDGKLRFPGDADTTVSLTLPLNGDWVSFEISGETASAAKGDAKIEAHQDTATGAKIASKDATVFSFDPASLTITNPGTYQFVGNRYTATGGFAASYSAEGRLKPTGLDCGAPQLADLKIGLMQNDVTSGDGTILIWDTPTIAWDAGVAAGTTVSVPSSIKRISRLPTPCNDVAPTVAPLYDQPGKADTLDPASLQPPTGCPGSAPATSFDTPSTGMPATFVTRATDATGAEVATVTYQRKSARVIGVFKTWTVVFNTTDNSFETIRERGWRLDVISTGASQKATTDAADAAPSTVPVLAPTANTVVNDPANEVVENGAPTNFTR